LNCRSARAAVIVEELANKRRCPVVVLDTHGEYVTIGIPGKHLKELAAKGLVEIKDYPFDFKVSVYASATEATTKILNKYGVELTNSGRYSVRNLPSHWEKTCNKEVETEIKDAAGEEVKPGHVMIVDAKGLGTDERSNIFTCLLRILWKARAEEDLEPLVLMVEDAEAIEPKTLGRAASKEEKLESRYCFLSTPLRLVARFFHR
jgi:DNA-binding MarR family transcriptional regulator